MAIFPATLPVALQDGYTLSPENPVVRTEMEGGPARQRRRFTQAATKYSVTWSFSLDEMAIFETWHKNDIYDGVAWFTIDLLNGQGVTTQTARFTEMWKASAKGHGEFIVTGTLETSTRPLN